MRQPSYCPTGCFNRQQTIGQMGLVIEALILQALAFQGKKETEQALAALEKALALAQPEGYVRMFLDEGEADDEIALPGPVTSGRERLCGRAAVHDW